MTPQLEACIAAARDKHAENLVVLDLRGLSDIADYFLICHGNTDRQVVAIADAIDERLTTEFGVHPKHVEGRRSGEWVLMDYIDVVVHLFIEEKREFYGLERLWGDAPNVAPAAASSDGDARASNVST